ncbi:MAG: succinate dehydrogenase [Chloroflexi bacterium CFX7]|nr:succinate dehydrogenase [Chloroflexi bacterium CFX7]MCK6565574.1 succinate dehydrogenase cytochrome b subunit [Dehalococcoidia bacterium]MCL4231299.1 succinate dehydrogenase cytochrome b subunit [Dehalococcoidia bacterium]RIL02137.1 MAG: succinate dehydrogenase [bacterium]
MQAETTGRRNAVPTVRGRRQHQYWLLDLYGSAIGKKAVMAVTGIVLLGFVFAHMTGNLKVYYNDDGESLNHYSEWLRDVGEPVVPHEGLLWAVRGVLAVSLLLHVHAATTLTLLNRKARPVAYKGGRKYAAADYAARTMRWSGIIVAAFLVFHLLDLTAGRANPDFVSGQPYQNLVASFEREPVAAAYIVANLLLGMHIYHGAWSLFQSLGLNHPRFNRWRRGFAALFAAAIVVGNVSIPIAVLTGVLD